MSLLQRFEHVGGGRDFTRTSHYNNRGLEGYHGFEPPAAAEAEGGPMTELVDESLTGRDAPAARARGKPEDARGRDAAIVLVLSLLFPGCGHAYARRWLRAVLWSLFFAALVFPAAIFAFAVWSSFSPAALLWIALLLALFSLACAAGPAVEALRGRLFGSGGRASAPASIGALAAYAAAFTVLLGVEAGWFLTSSLESRRAETSRLEPVIAAGRSVTVLRSRYVRPVHGDVVLCRAPWPGEAPAAAPETLARVVARPRDTVQVRQGRLLVDGIEIDLRRNDQRKALERAGRAERRRQLLPGSKPPSDGLLPGAQIDWGGAGRGPLLIPEGCWLVILDVGEMDIGPDGSSSPPARGILVGKEHLLGRALLRTEAR
jgi:hypothetical protein